MKAPRILLFLIPLMTVITVGLGLRIGAEKGALAARLFAAPMPTHGDTVTWQLFTYKNERGVDEATSIRDLRVTVRAHGQTATWSGASSEQGIAEVVFPFRWLRSEESIGFEVRVGSETAPLLQAEIPPTTIRGDRSQERFVRPLKGGLAIQVIPLDGQLAAGFASRVFVRVTDSLSRPIPRISLALTPEPGLTTPERITTCDNGWAEFEATAIMHVNELRITTTESDPSQRSEWLGSLPVSAGASDARFSRTPAPNAPFLVTVAAGNSRKEVFAEIDDESGRIFAGEFPFREVNGQHVATFEAPKLPPGNYWLVTAGTPAGTMATDQTGSLARPFVVGEGPSSSCETGASLARSQRSLFPRILVKDSKLDRHASDRKNKTLGLSIALAGLLLGALLETLLILRAVRASASELKRASQEEGDEEALGAQHAGGRLVVGVLISLLGFSLLAAIVVWSSR